MKKCNVCKMVKPETEFYTLQRKTKDGIKKGLRYLCKGCDKRKSNKANLDRDWQLRRRYGITVKDYNEMYERQGRKCAICGSPNDGKKRFSVDHNHSTGKVRALLCQKCNLMIGASREQPFILGRAIEYLGMYE